MILQALAFSFLLCSVRGFSVQSAADKGDDFSGNSIDDDDSISAILEKANVNVGRAPNEPMVIDGDIAMPTMLRNADPCTLQNCLWPKATDGNVYIPYTISNQYSQSERNVIMRGLQSFAQASCIRFFPRNGQRDFVNIQSASGCYSFLGRQGRGQVVSLARPNCVVHKIVQHELLHALGFNHEQTRSDRDDHVRILFQNIIPGMQFNFAKKRTRNLGTPYDYTSVMHYDRFAFSRNQQPTIIPIPNSNVAIGTSRQMSQIDIQRINILYGCNREQFNPEAKNQHL